MTHVVTESKNRAAFMVPWVGQYLVFLVFTVHTIPILPVPSPSTVLDIHEINHVNRNLGSASRLFCSTLVNKIITRHGKVATSDNQPQDANAFRSINPSNEPPTGHSQSSNGHAAPHP